MSAPGPRWTPEEDGLIRSMGTAGESATAIATLLKRKAAGVHQRSLTRDQVGPFAARAEAKVEIIHLQGHGNIRPRGAVVSVAPSLRICLLGDPELEPGGSRDFRSACFYG
jgi:hypothetical protein